MTKRRAPPNGGISRLERNQLRLRVIAEALENGWDLPRPARQFLIRSLRRVGAGEDANVVLGVVAKRGERKSLAQAKSSDRKKFALAWIASAIRPKDDASIDGGLGMTLDDACDAAAVAFGFTSETLRTYWNNNRDLRSPTFGPPVSALPIHRKVAE